MVHTFSQDDIRLLLPIYQTMVAVKGGTVDVSNVDVAKLTDAVNDEQHINTLIERVNDLNDSIGLEEFGFVFD